MINSRLKHLLRLRSPELFSFPPVKYNHCRDFTKPSLAQGHVEFIVLCHYWAVMAMISENGTDGDSFRF